MTRISQSLFSLLAITSICMSMGGCSSDTGTTTAESSRYEAAGDEGSPADNSNRLAAVGTPVEPDGSPADSDGSMTNPAAAVPPVVDGIFDEPEIVTSGLAPLAEGASADDAIEFFDKTNDALRNLMNSQSHFASPEQQLAEAKRISRMKLDAAEQVLSMNELADETLVVASRNKLEALSQLAGLQDVKSANELEKYADQLASSDNPDLVNESRVVRIGFALERVRNGQDKTPETLLALTQEFKQVEGELGMPAFFTLQQCFTILGQYGYDEAAREVRSLIAERFSDHSDPQIAQAAQQMASGSRFDNIDRLQRKLGKGEEVTPAQWQSTIEELVTGSKDIGTFQYLAGLALNAEAMGNEELAEQVFSTIDKSFVQSQDSEQPLTKEAEAFIAASVARRDSIGKPIEIDYPDLAGGELDWASYRGAIVAMPFWITSQPQSIMVVPMLQELQDKYAGKLKVLGVNLDDSDEDLAAFRNSYKLNFPSVRNPDPTKRSIRDPLAKQLGIASFPFIAIVDAEGKVLKILMGPQPDLDKTIEGLIE